MALTFMPGFEGVRWYLGQYRAYVEFYKARRTVPAYREFLKQQGFQRVPFKGVLPDLSTIPVIDKDSYVKAFGVEQCCVRGKLPTTGMMVDESSGSTGLPTNWPRGRRERTKNRRMLQFSIRRTIGSDPFFAINAFALGPWATGMNVTMALADIAIVKSTGPDVEKIINTMKVFGPRYKYVIFGYPPFFKTLVDRGEIDWDTYYVHMLVGGEAITETLRDYLMAKGAKGVTSGIGATDLELSIAAETVFTIELRKKIIANPSLAERLVKHSGPPPMIFQYNPLDFLVEETEEGELLFSICRPGYLSPKIRYNLHDTGHILRFPEISRILKEEGIEMESLKGGYVPPLPILFHYGRSNSTISYFGANLAPADVHETLCRVESLAEKFNTFMIKHYEDEEANKKLIFDVELHDQVDPSEFEEERLNNEFLSTLAGINHELGNSLSMMPEVSIPQLQLYRKGEGPFRENQGRIKQKYIA
ncbi:MAG: phenylacetate--CoA ligase family protein [Candidatus Kapaibacterium sp.]